MFTKNMKQKLFFGFICIFAGLFFSIFYEIILHFDGVWGISAIALGFSTGDFIILMGIIEDFYGSERNG